MIQVITIQLTPPGLLAALKAEHAKRLQPLGYNLHDTFQITGLSTRTLRRLVKRGLLRPSRATSRLIFSRVEIERFLNETTSR